MLKLEKIYAGYRFRTVVGNINAEIASGEKVIISGERKSGKTTLLETAAGIIPPVSGCVFFDYLPITEYSRKELGKRLCHIPQDILPRDKVFRLISAVKSGCEYILIDEPFAFLSEKQQNELLNIMNSEPSCSFLITENSTSPIKRDGFKNLHLSTDYGLKKTAPSAENAVYM